MGKTTNPKASKTNDDYRILVVPKRRGLKAANEVYNFIHGELDNARIETVMVRQNPAIVRRERASDALLKALKANAARNHLDSCLHEENEGVGDGCLNCITNAAIAQAEG